MKAIILCAGKGRRTGFTYPKSLQPFSDGSFLLKKNLQILKEIGFRSSDVIIATGFREDLIKKKNK